MAGDSSKWASKRVSTFRSSLRWHCAKSRSSRTTAPSSAFTSGFARRPGTLFRSLVLSEFVDAPLQQSFFDANDLAGVRVADPFMGGGTPVVEANRVGCDVTGLDINPMSTWIVRQEIQDLDLDAYQHTADQMIAELGHDIDQLYRTNCSIYGDANVPVKCFLWVKVIDCARCDTPIDLFPSHVVAENKRHPKNVLICSHCGDLNEVDDRHQPGNCQTCDTALIATGPARRGRCPCPKCGHINSYPRDDGHSIRHRMFALEYFNPSRRDTHRGRFFKKPDAEDLVRAEEAESRWSGFSPRFVPDQEIPLGDETRRLHRWNYRFWRDLFGPRQLLGLELSCRLIAQIDDKRIRHALATNLSDLLRYQNMLCRYHAGALKCLDVFAVHGFPVGQVYCEANLLGIVDGNGTNVGSGGWTNVIAKFVKAKQFCDAPFEVSRNGARKMRIPISGERIGEEWNGRRRIVQLGCGTATKLELPKDSFDGVFTDPPYFGNVQYAELMDFCLVWLRRLAGTQALRFDPPTTRSTDELTGNGTQGRGLEHFTEGLAAVWNRAAYALKPGAPLAFTFHHNELSAYCAVGVAILDAGFACTASLPCPAEMSGSIHILGTQSSIIDTVFVCRTEGAIPRDWICDTADQLTALVARDLADLEAAGRKPTYGDARCVMYGHLARLAIWRLRPTWDATAPIQRKIHAFEEAMMVFDDPKDLIERTLGAPREDASLGPLFSAAQPLSEVRDAVSF